MLIGQHYEHGKVCEEAVGYYKRVNEIQFMSSHRLNVHAQDLNIPMCQNATERCRLID
jgi:hypothetical protein